jgi:5-methyltetrahydropteroyltriglutamate--homocysteine methyltransferase
MCENCLPSTPTSHSSVKPRALAAAAGLRSTAVKSAPMPGIPKGPRILTTTVGSYPVPEWLSALPSEQAVIDATRVVFDVQRQAGIDLPTDGELYRFDINHPDTNGMIEYFIRPMEGISSVVGRSITEEFARHSPMGFRRKPAGVVTGPLGEGSLNLLADCQRAALSSSP